MHPNFRSCLVAIAVALAWPAAAAAAPERPDASFAIAPESPRAGQTLELVSASCEPSGRLVQQNWDLDGDGEFDDAQGASASTAFPAGPHAVGLEVVGSGGARDVQRRTIIVNTEYVLPEEESARLLSPFPVVTLGGRLTSAGARIKLLTVRAPVCSLVQVGCRGRGCPARRASSYVGRKPLRLRRFQRAYRAGAVITVRVSKGRSIGKFTRFTIRKGAAPRRQDLCLRPGASVGSRCPRG